MSESILSIEKEEQLTLSDSLTHIIHELEQNRNLDPGKLCSIIKEAEVRPEDLMPWADFDHPIQDSYGRKQVYLGDNYEVMVMSWRPGDFSTIHDHGYTQWGAVQIFGPAEHATFRYDEGEIHTLARWQVAPGDVLGVGHSLIHQMGNPTQDQKFLSLHIYGIAENIENVTGDARIFELEDEEIQRVDGGVFFALPSAECKSVDAQVKSDFATGFRHRIELMERLRRREEVGDVEGEKSAEEVYSSAFGIKRREELMKMLDGIIGEGDQVKNSIQWRILNHELKKGAELQSARKGEARSKDDFHRYAMKYDALIGRPCLDGFMGPYLKFVKEKFPLDFMNSQIISLGVGTGLVEEFMMNELEVPHENLYGIDISEAMVQVARERVHSDVGDVLELDPAVKQWDVAYSGLNVFHYLDHNRLEEAIEKTASILKDGGWFIADLISPDHIRWYPNVMKSEDGNIISLRTPRLVEQEGSLFQESEIINLDFSSGELEIDYAGKHMRFLPPMHRMRAYFERYFSGKVHFFDAHSLESISDLADTCPSTRYLVLAQK